ncbi:MAG: ABC transporter permease [Kofleriaceae bacterium]
MTDRRVPSRIASLAAIGAMSVRRLFRARGLWVGTLIAAVPPAFAFAIGQSSRRDDGRTPVLFMFEVLIVGILSAMFVASSIGEELEDRTATYLWSRPVARWTLPVGKILALAPVTIALALIGWLCVYTSAVGGLPPPASYFALVAEALAISTIGAAIALLVPKHAMALSIAYLVFFDVPLGVLPAKLQHLSVSYQTRAIAEIDWAATDQSAAVITIVAITAVWAMVGALRLRRLEA